jgi:hypothetical protein
MGPSDLMPIDPGLLALVKDAQHGKNGLQPFVREIMLLECHVAGTGYADAEEAEPELNVGDILCLQREPHNTHDAKAIQIFDEKGRRLGYVPRAQNEVLANLMDAGKLLFGKLDTKKWRDDWLWIEIRIFMRD